jgi:NADPH:quinone reductase-like Zn-dependent oxidoreductase
MQGSGPLTYRSFLIWMRADWFIGFRPCVNLAEKYILINGGTGDVGHYALQIAVARGTKVTVTCSSYNLDVTKSLGASHIIDYEKQGVSAGKIIVTTGNS